MKATEWKLGISSWFYGNDFSKKTFENALADGVKCIEISKGDIWQPDLKAIKKNADAVGMEI